MISQDSPNMALYKIKSPRPAMFEFALRWLTAVCFSEDYFFLRTVNILVDHGSNQLHLPDVDGLYHKTTSQ